MQIEEDPNNDDLTSSEDAVIPESSYPKDHHDVYVTMPADVSCAMGRLLKELLYLNFVNKRLTQKYFFTVVHDRLRFHPRCGILVKLSSNNKYVKYIFIIYL